MNDAEKHIYMLFENLENQNFFLHVHKVATTSVPDKVVTILRT